MILGLSGLYVFGGTCSEGADNGQGSPRPERRKRHSLESGPFGIKGSSAEPQHRPFLARFLSVRPLLEPCPASRLQAHLGDPGEKGLHGGGTLGRIGLGA